MRSQRNCHPTMISQLRRTLRFVVHVTNAAYRERFGTEVTNLGAEMCRSSFVRAFCRGGMFLGQETGSFQRLGLFLSRKLIAASFLLVAAQVLVLAFRNSTRPLTGPSEFVQLALGLLSIAACRGAFHRSRGIAKYPWRILTISFAIWTIAQACAIWATNANSWSIDQLSDTLFFLSAAPFGMLPFLDPDDPSGRFDRLHVLDFIQVGIFWLSTCLWFSDRVWLSSTAWGFGPFLWSRNIAFDAVLAGMLLLRSFLNPSKAFRRFFLWMAVFLTFSGLADSYSLNEANGVQSGDWFDLVWTTLLAVPILIAVSWKHDARPGPREQRSQSVAINQIFPLLYPLLSFLMLSRIDNVYRHFAPALFVFAFITLGARILIIQHRQRLSQEQLLRDAKKREQSEQALRESEIQYRLLFNTNPIPMWVFDRETLRFLAVNKAAIRHYGFSEQEFLAMTIADIRPEEDVPKLLADTAQKVKGLQEPRTWRHRKRDGTIIHVDIIGHDLRFRGLDAELIAAYDITQRLEAERALIQAEEKYRGTFEDAVVGMFQADAEGHPISINRALAEIQGYDSPDQALRVIPNILMHLFGNSPQPQHQSEEVRRELLEKGVVRNLELQFSRNDGSRRNVVANIRAVRNDSGTLMLLEGTVEDVTDRKRAEDRIQFLAYYDALTGLPNRTLLQDRLAQALASAERRDEKVALLFLDLDRFKIINDSLGHSFGDLLLQETAERLKKWQRAQDTVARIGGDEFVIALTGIKEISDVAVVTERIMDLITADYVIQNRRFNLSCSIGISIYPEHGRDNETLIKNADAAMYCAKESGRNAFRFFTDEMNVQVMERLTIEHHLRSALENQEFFLVYQPQIDLATSRICGMEALIRWNQPEIGAITPDRFIRVAENSGLILPIGEWVLQTACATVKARHEQGLPRIPVAVNVSAIQFRQEGFCEVVRRVLRDSGLSPECLELEVTETVLLSSSEVTPLVMQELKRMGVRLAIDDFGTGYSSLSYLRQFRVNRLKIDRSFIKSVAQNADDAAITGAIIRMAKSLGLRVIAEGVETEKQMAFLQAQGCDEVQGYFFSKPLSEAEMMERLRVEPVASSARRAGAS